MIIGDIKNQISSYLKQPVSAFLLTSGEDTLLNAINNARRTAERIHDFYYAQINALLQVANNPTGGNITLSSAAAVGVAPITVGPLVSGKTYQILTFVAGDNFTNVGGTNASGTIFVATGTTPTTWTHASILQLQTVLNLKRVCNVLLPIAGGAYLPIEFKDQDVYVERVRQQSGRNPYNPAGALPLNLTSALAVQQGQTINVYSSTGAAITYPIVAQLDSIQFMPDYTQNSDQDFFCIASPEFLQWQAILDGNKLWSQFVPLQQGAVVEESVQSFAQEALASLIAWDQSLSTGQHPNKPALPQPPPRRRAPAPAAA